MPVQNAKARWADRTIAEAQATVRTIMARVKDDTPSWPLLPTLKDYQYAGLHAATILASAIELVEHMERTP
jgi:hypothetical protein